MGARWYDARIGRWISADTIVPGNASGASGGLATVGYNGNLRLTPLTVGFHEGQFLSALNSENAELLEFGPPALWDDETRQKHIVPRGPTNPQALNRYAYCLNNAVRFTDPSGYCIPGLNCPDDDQQDTVYDVYGYNCTLAECHGPPVKNKAGTGRRPRFKENEFITWIAFERLLDAVYQDILVEETPGAFPWPPDSLEAGRGKYDTPFWNGRMEDTTVCIEGHGCFTRSEVNYIAQGMWGAQGGESLDVTVAVVHGWNQKKYGHWATPGEVYWAEFGWLYYHNKTE